MYTLKSNNITHELLEKNDINAINDEITNLKKLCDTMQSSIQNNLKQINTIIKDITTVKEGITTVKEDITTVKEDITNVKEDIIKIKKGATPVASEGGI